jgi:serine/threonine-protein kinase ATR
VAKAAAEAAEAIATHNHFTCVNYVEALQRGVKYIYQTMPRLLTVWLDLGEFNEITKKNSIVQLKVQQITRLMERAVGKIMTYQFLTAFPQMISRITHSNLEVREVLVRLVYHVIRDYPAQALWPTIGAMQSTRKDRRDIAETILQKAMVRCCNTNRSLPQGVKQKDVRADLQARINDARKLSGVLLRLAEDKPEGKPREVSIATKYKYVTAAFPSSMIMPLQDALTCVLPPPGSPLKGHLAFPSMAVSINGR